MLTRKKVYKTLHKEIYILEIECNSRTELKDRLQISSFKDDYIICLKSVLFVMERRKIVQSVKTIIVLFRSYKKKIVPKIHLKIVFL